MKKKIYLILVIIFVSISISLGQQKLKNGTIAPDFTAISNVDKNINLYKMLEKSPIVIVFYRGQWCSYCNKYMKDLQDSLSLIEKAGARVIAVTPENNENIGKTIEKTEANFNIIYDKNHKIMDKYKVSWQLSGAKNTIYKLAGININKASGNEDRVLPVPATYIIGSNRKIIGGYFNPDYKIRMPVKNIIKILESIK